MGREEREQRDGREQCDDERSLNRVAARVPVLVALWRAADDRAFDGVCEPAGDRQQACEADR